MEIFNVLDINTLTKKEQKAIRSLERWAIGWPNSLILDSWLDGLIVMTRDNRKLKGENNDNK